MRWNFDSPLDRSEYSVLQRQLLAYGRWFSPGTPASSTTKTGRHDIAEIFKIEPRIKIKTVSKLQEAKHLVIYQYNNSQQN
jgi:hypothetical protein